MDKKYETFTYSELLVEFRTVTEKTESLKRDLILEMGKRKELEGVEKKKVAAIITIDLKELVSPTYVRNILSGVGQTDPKFASSSEKKKLREKGIEEEKKILVAAGGMGQELEPPLEPEKQLQPNEDITSNLIPNDDIIDQRPQEEKIQESNDAEEELDKIHLIRELKIENNNLTQQLTEIDKLREENNKLRETITELEKENSKLFNRNKELEDENNKLKQEIRALRNAPKTTPVNDSRFSSKSHDDYHKNKYYKITKGK